MKYLLFVFLATVCSSYAQTVSTFSAGSPLAGDWTYSFADGALTITGGDDAGGYQFDTVAGGPLDFTILPSLVELTARVNLDNAAAAFTISFEDGNGISAASATFSTAAFGSGFTTVTSALTSTGNGQLNNISFFSINGAGAGGNLFRMSFDNLSAIPEPSTWAFMIGGAALAMVAGRRRRRAVPVVA